MEVSGLTTSLLLKECRFLPQAAFTDHNDHECLTCSELLEIACIQTVFILLQFSNMSLGMERQKMDMLIDIIFSQPIGWHMDLVSYPLSMVEQLKLAHTTV